mgnify:CR=1 FL=1
MVNVQHPICRLRTTAYCTASVLLNEEAVILIKRDAVFSYEVPLSLMVTISPISLTVKAWMTLLPILPRRSLTAFTARHVGCRVSLVSEEISQRFYFFASCACFHVQPPRSSVPMLQQSAVPRHSLILAGGPPERVSHEPLDPLRVQTPTNYSC